jgi:hypothetical protein
MEVVVSFMNTLVWIVVRHHMYKINVLLYMEKVA